LVFYPYFCPWTFKPNLYKVFWVKQSIRNWWSRTLWRSTLISARDKKRRWTWRRNAPSRFEGEVTSL